MVDRSATKKMSVKQQCQLLGLARASMYRAPKPMSAINLDLMRRIDEQYMDKPFYGARRMAAVLRRQGYVVTRKRVRRLMRIMGIEAIYRKPNLSRRHPQHKIYPYLLRNVAIVCVNHVWSCDITYIPMKHGFLYLVGIVDWFSRKILAWRLSIALDADFCVEALRWPPFVRQKIEKLRWKPTLVEEAGCYTGFHVF